MLTLTLMYREYCGLCRTMLDALRPWQAQYGFEIDVVDVDADAELEARYNELVPVLLHHEHEICHWFLDENALRSHLQTHLPGQA